MVCYIITTQQKTWASTSTRLSFEAVAIAHAVDE